MAAWRPVKRREFIRKLRALGFDGPYSGTRHQFMVWQQHRQTIPTNSEYSVPQIRLLLRQVESILARTISLDEWNSL
ncbi:MAG TPA: type II toxin-antitoxin system HicA family toxin [Verrucomicrobiota bacterium]|nr:type II toxin-antitoxin system HicA family toxin [Verrucomicrobiota bacterium]